MNYKSYKITNGKMKKVQSGNLDCTVYHVSPVYSGKILANVKLNENASQPTPIPAKLSVLNLTEGKLEYERLSVVQRNPNIFDDSTFGIFGNVSELSRYYNFTNSLDSFSYSNFTYNNVDFFQRGVVYYSDNVNKTIVFSSPETWIKYKTDFLSDMPVPA